LDDWIVSALFTLAGLIVGWLGKLITTRIADRRSERGDASLVFNQAMVIIEQQNERINILRGEIVSQEERLSCEIRVLRDEVKSLIEDNIKTSEELFIHKALVKQLEEDRERDREKIERLEAKCARYEEILLDGPGWLRDAAIEAGLKDK